MAEDGDQPSRRLAWETSFRHFYETNEDLLDILILFFKTGSENNEFCLRGVATPLTKGEEAKDALRRAHPHFDHHSPGLKMDLLWMERKLGGPEGPAAPEIITHSLLLGAGTFWNPVADL